MQVIICIGGEIIEVIKRNRAQFNFSCSGCSRRYLLSAYSEVSIKRPVLLNDVSNKRPHTGISYRNFFHFTIIPSQKMSWVSREADKVKEL